MVVTKHGHQSYADDPHGRVFRVIYPENDDSELDGPPTDHNRRPYLKPDGSLHTWLTLGTDQTRPQLIAKVVAGTKPKLRGTPITPANEPVVYWVNVQRDLLTQAQNVQIDNWLAANPQWSNNFIDLGVGDTATLTAGLISPCWIVVAGGGTPSIGTLQRTVAVAAHSIALWIA